MRCSSPSCRIWRIFAAVHLASRVPPNPVRARKLGHEQSPERRMLISNKSDGVKQLVWPPWECSRIRAKAHCRGSFVPFPSICSRQRNPRVTCACPSGSPLAPHRSFASRPPASAHRPLRNSHPALCEQNELGMSSNKFWATHFIPSCEGGQLNARGSLSDVFWTYSFVSSVIWYFNWNIRSVLTLWWNPLD